MSEIETELLDKYKSELETHDGISSELIDSLAEELFKDSPNAERLAEIIKAKGLAKNDKAR